MSGSNKWSKAAQPLGDQGIEKVRKVAEEGANRVNGVLIDGLSAQAMVAVYDGLNEQNKAKFKALSVIKAAEVALKLVNEGAKA